MIKTIFANFSWHNSVAFRSNTCNASPLRKICVKRYWFVPVVMLLPIKTWAIASLERRTSKRFLGWSRMLIICLTRVKSSLVGSVRTKILCMSTLSSDTGIYLTINSSRLIGSVTFLALVHPLSVRGYFYFSWRGMMHYSAS